MTKPFASISIDLDDLWAYQRTLGDSAWEQRRSYLRLAVPRMLDALAQAGWQATVFLVGADAARGDADQVLGPIAAGGHEVGNHSFGHACWLHRYDAGALREELHRADQAIRAATGSRPVGFRGPGYCWDTTLLEAVADQGYLFDSSTLPTYLGPLLRRRLLQTARLTASERALRGDLFGSVSNGVLPIRPYRWRLPDGRRLLELPVTTVPLVRVPFHQSYIVYLASLSRRLARGYFRTALAACRAAGVEPNILFHPLDWLGGDEVPELRFFPGMDQSARTKVAVLQDSLRLLQESFTCETLGAQAARRLAGGGLSERAAPPAIAGRTVIMDPLWGSREGA